MMYLIFICWRYITTNINGVFDIKRLSRFNINALRISMYVDINCNVGFVDDRKVNICVNNGM